MADTYLVEIRLARTKWRIRQIIVSAVSALHLEPFMEHNPHITLFGPFVLDEGSTPEELLAVIGNVAHASGPAPFMINGWEMRKGMHGSVIAFAVTPSPVLKDLARSLSEALSKISTSLNAWDSQPDTKWYHVTVANGLDSTTAEACFCQIVNNKRTTLTDGSIICRIAALLHRLRDLFHSGGDMRFPPILFDGSGLRITVIQNQEILTEYDLIDNCWIHGDHSHDGRTWQCSLKQFRLLKGYELTEPVHRERDDIFFIADLHLGHANIIRYCSRPFIFSDCAEMDAVLIRNWNMTAGSDAPIYHIGDLRYGDHALPAARYCEQLTGKVTYIFGNHDQPQEGWIHDIILNFGGRTYFLIHDPDEVPAGFDGWVIHGHHHNNDLAKFPFMDFVHRRINVSAEVVGYVPVGIREIDALIRKHEGETMARPILLRYPYIPPDENEHLWRQPNQVRS